MSNVAELPLISLRLQTQGLLVMEDSVQEHVVQNRKRQGDQDENAKQAKGEQSPCATGPC